MIEGALAVWYLLTAASIAFMVYDLATNTPAMDVMKGAWVLITLYLGPIGLFMYLLSCRQPRVSTIFRFLLTGRLPHAPAYPMASQKLRISF
jgi:hypothetical protein